MRVLITGASSGIGAELALQYAKQGYDLCLSGRNINRLESVAKKCCEYGASVHAVSIDVTDREAMDRWILDQDDELAVDIVIANAGISVGQKKRSRQLSDDILSTNITGVLNTIDPLISRFQKRKSGHIVVISSLASYRAFPGRGAYAASKAALRCLCDDWRLALKEDNIRVTCVHPGFIKTPLTDQNKHAMPGIMPVEEAASKIIYAVKAGKSVIAFPWTSFFAARLLQVLPVWLSDWFVQKMSNR